MYMDIRTFPHTNNYFNAGISALYDSGFHFRKIKEELIIVCMASWSVRDVALASWIKSWNKSKVLIVSDSRFFPLAKYLQLKNRDIIEVCHTSEFYGVLGDFLWRGKLYSIKHEAGTPHLTDMEYVSLQYALNGISVEKQALYMGLSSKTVFAHRAASARKLNVKKLPHLLSPRILNSSPSSSKEYC